MRLHSIQIQFLSLLVFQTQGFLQCNLCTPLIVDYLRLPILIRGHYKVHNFLKLFYIQLPQYKKKLQENQKL